MNDRAISPDQALKRALPDVPVVGFDYRRRDKAEKAALREAFEMGERQAFLAHLLRDGGESLRIQGFTERNLESLRRGKVPHGYNVHHIKPLDDGGDNRFDNLVLLRAHPTHEAIHRYLDPQLRGLEIGQSRQVSLPSPAPGAYRGRLAAREEPQRAMLQQRLAGRDR
jgi:hypothetical protein